MSEAVLDLAVQLAQRAGAVQREHYERRIEIGTKSTPSDLVTTVDHACEALIVDELRTRRPDDAVLAEEGRGLDRKGAEWRWVIDPLDGTVNFAHGYPRFCVSIGVERRGQREVGVVYDPLLDELFTATRGGGARLGERRIHVTDEPELSRCLVATGFAYDDERRAANLGHFSAFARASRGIRRDGSAALDLCYVACGRIDGFWEIALHPWDVAAGLLMVTEAGGRVSDLRGGPAPASGGETLASNGSVHDAMLALLAA